MEPGLTIIVLGIIFLATLTRATFGFGDSLVAMPLLALLVDMRVATPLVALVAATVGVCIIARSYQSVQFASAWRLVIAGAIGVPIGLLLLSDPAMDQALKLTLAVVVVAFASFLLAKPEAFALKAEGSAWFFGFVAGVFGGACNINGPPVVVYGTLRRWPPETFRATLQGYFLPIGLFIVFGHGLSGLWTQPVLEIYAMSVPIVGVAFFLGHWLSERLSRERFVRYIYALLVGMGLLLAAQNL